MHDSGRPVVVFSGGGTGGHLYPALALADALRALRPDVRAVFVGARRGVEARILPARGETHHLVPVRGFQRGRGLGNWSALPALGRSLLQVAKLFFRLRPEAVVVTGGYAGAPAGLVAVLTGVPLVLQEQNSVPGMTTRALSRWARQIHLAFPEARDHLPSRVGSRLRVSGNPVRPVPDVGRTAARSAFSLSADATVLLVVGGSQGSAALNRALLDAVEALAREELDRPEGLEILWSTGPGHHEGVEDALALAGGPEWIRAVPYIEEMPAALAAADLAVSRAGAMGTAELLNHGVPSVLVPLPTAAADHQARNARALEEAGAAVVAPEAGLTGAALWKKIGRLAADEALRERMSRAALERARPDAARRIAAEVASLLPEVVA